MSYQVPVHVVVGSTIVEPIDTGWLVTKVLHSQASILSPPAPDRPNLVRVPCASMEDVIICLADHQSGHEHSVDGTPFTG